MKHELTLLLTSAGRRVELLRCFMEDARALGIGLRTIAADSSPKLSAACAVADENIEAPRCSDPAYAHFLLDICASRKVDLLVPTIDTELLAIASLHESFLAAGTYAAISSPEIVALARDKLATAEKLAAAGISTPNTRAFVKGNEPALPYPFIVKPRGGSSSKGIYIVHASGDLALAQVQEDSIIQELLAGQEYTINMYFDRRGSLKCVIPHRRVETRAGEVSKGQTARLPELEAVGWKLGELLKGARGTLCFQAIMSGDGRAAVFEINARFGGGYPIAHHAGAPFSRWLLEEVGGRPSTANNDWRGGVTMLRYDAAVFL